MANTTPVTGSAGSAGNDSTPAGCKARCAREISTATYRSAGQQRGLARSMDRASVPGPAPQSTKVNGSGWPNSIPPRVEGAGQYGAEERAYFGAGDEVATTAGAAARVKNRTRVVERRVDVLAEAKGTVRTNRADEAVAEIVIIHRPPAVRRR